MEGVPAGPASMRPFRSRVSIQTGSLPYSHRSKGPESGAGSTRELGGNPVKELLTEVRLTKPASRWLGMTAAVLGLFVLVHLVVMLIDGGGWDGAVSYWRWEPGC